MSMFGEPPTLDEHLALLRKTVGRHDEIGEPVSEVIAALLLAYDERTAEVGTLRAKSEHFTGGRN